MTSSDPRWIATVTYRSAEHGMIDVQHHLEELFEIHDLVERGPDWNTIEKVVVILNPKHQHDYSTIEEAETR